MRPLLRNYTYALHRIPPIFRLQAFSTSAPILRTPKHNVPSPDRQTPPDEPPKFGKKKHRSPQGGKALLKRAAAAAAVAGSSGSPGKHGPHAAGSKGMDHYSTGTSPATVPPVSTFTARKPRIVTAYNTADKYDLAVCIRLLRQQGYIPDPFTTGLLDYVIHLRISLGSPSTTTIPPARPVSIGPNTPQQSGVEKGDIFIFPSGNIVSWGVPEGQISALVMGLVSAAENPIEEGEVESEDLEWVEMLGVKGGWVRGEVIYVGVIPDTSQIIDSLKEDRSRQTEGDVGSRSMLGRDGERTEERQEKQKEALKSSDDSYNNPLTLACMQVTPASPQIAECNPHPPYDPSETLPVLLIKLAFSSGLSRSTKLAHLESLLSSYLQSTSSIPRHLSSSTASRLPFTRSFILRKTGELLLLRAQLNLYSELTDPLPELFWDTKHELGLEKAYEDVCRALDVERRIEVANGRMDYANEVVGILRGTLSERHGLVLEWMIILLIAVEVGFELARLVRERWEKKRAATASEDKWDKDDELTLTVNSS